MEESKILDTDVAEESQAKPQTVSIEVYSQLYNQARELEIRYKNLLELYNALVEMYLSKK